MMKDTPLIITNLGQMFHGDSLDLIQQLDDNSIDLVMTSPPFALLRKKEYGNKEQHEYVNWIAQFAKLLLPKLKETGSLVMDLGGAYQRGLPVRSLYNYRVLLKFCDELGYNLAEEFFWYNPAKLPSPIEWVNKRKIRVKDAVNTVWWFSKTAFPKANVERVLQPYSDRMLKLIKKKDKYFTPKERPSGHDISMSFANDNGGAIPPNLLQFSNSESSSKYLRFCKAIESKGHPARFPGKLPEFFINFLTDPGDTVIDIFAGSNTTGAIAESMGRKWFSFELSLEYVANASLRFATSPEEAKCFHESILKGESINITSSQDLFSNT